MESSEETLIIYFNRIRKVINHINDLINLNGTPINLRISNHVLNQFYCNPNIDLS